MTRSEYEQKLMETGLKIEESRLRALEICEETARIELAVAQAKLRMLNQGA